jgi:hypothetical protein
MKIFYVYGHFIPNSETPFYIGKGRKKRAWDKCGRTYWWHNIVNKNGFEVRILYETDDESSAFSIEKELIEHYGRKNTGTGVLINLTDGGEGASGVIRTEEIKKAMYNDVWKTNVVFGAQKRKNNAEWRKNKIESCKLLASREDWIETVVLKNREMAKTTEWIQKQKEGARRYYSNSENKKKHRAAVSKPRSRYFGKVEGPDGVIHKVYSVPSFCKQHNLVVVSFRRIKSQLGRVYRGWKYIGK